MSSTSKNIQVGKPLRAWRNLLNLSIFSAYFYAFMEWLFFVTKPSSLSLLAPFETVLVLVITGGIFALLLITLILIIFLFMQFISHHKWKLHFLALGQIVPATMLTITALIMFDNFTYTVFRFGVVSTIGLWRILYILGIGIIFWRAMHFIRHRTRARSKKFASYFSVGLLTVSISTLLASNISTDANRTNFISNGAEASSESPHIIILGSDGLNAGYLSAYGYNEETTPFLEQMAEDSLVAENAFTNASSTTASTTSALTGKEPAVTKVFRYPDVLRGQDTIEHMPGILKQYGYKTVQIGTPSYVDALKVNLVEGFDIVNNQSFDLHLQSVFNTVLGNTSSTYFVNSIIDRVNKRLLHIFFIQEMQNPVAAVNNPKVGMTDEQRVDQIIDILEQADSPVFIFAHLMETHGPFPVPSEQDSASDTRDTTLRWDKEIYEDAILLFDGHLERIYNQLDQTDQLNNTILVIYTDHGYRYAVNHRIPVIFHFPNHEYAGSIENNVQILDIPVTLMDYLGISIPNWMAGTSLLEGEPPANRDVISLVSGAPDKVAPPFFQIKIVQFIFCHRYYRLNVQENKWSSADIIGHTAKCDDNQIPSDEIVRQKILDYLEKYNYDIKSLQ